MENNRKLLSIIIPCYNSARFISETIEMLYAQKMNNCELILVDDGSKDNTLEVLKYYENRSEVKVIHQENSGVSVARNTGVAAANGRYIYFLDSDDKLPDNTLSFFRQILEEHSSCQIFTFGYEMRESGILKKRYTYPAFDNQEWKGCVLAQNFFTKKFCVHICACIFERNFLKQAELQFKPGMRIGEDVLFIHQAILQKNIKVYSSARICFIYQLRSDSATCANRSFDEDKYMALRIRQTFYNNYCKKYPLMQPYIDFFLCYNYLTTLYYYLRSNVNSTSINNWFYEDRILRYKSFPFVSLRLNAILTLSRFIPIKLLLKICKS